MKQSARLLLLVIIAMYSVACNQAPKQVSQKPTRSDSVEGADSAQASVEIKEDRFPAYTDPVYKPYISRELKVLIEEKLPGWRLPSSDSWEAYWFNAYKKANTLVDYASEDFNGDGKPDYAMLLENENGAYVVWVLQSQFAGYRAIELTELSEARVPLRNGLELIEKGQLNHMNMEEDGEDIKTIDLKNPGIQVSYFEASADTYYWKDGKFESVITGD